MSAVIYVLRHGETGANADDTFRGWRQVPLNATGRAEAKKAAAFLKGKGIKHIYASDLKRTMETAEAVRDELNIPMSDDSRLRAWDVGAFAGKARKTHQEAFDKYTKSPNETIPMGESMKEFSKRVQSAFKDYRGKKESPILLVTSASVCLQLEKMAEGKDVFGKPEQAIPPGGVMCVKGDQADEIFGKVKKTTSYGS